MKDIADFFSSISIIVAALAGLGVISKWKSERFDKIKIDALEKYEGLIRSVKDELAFLMSDDLKKEYGDYFVDTRSKEDFSEQMFKVEYDKKLRPTRFFINRKNEIFYNVREKLSLADKVLNVYCDYEGKRLGFTHNYFISISKVFEESLSHVTNAMNSQEDDEYVDESKDITRKVDFYYDADFSYCLMFNKFGYDFFKIAFIKTSPGSTGSFKDLYDKRVEVCSKVISLAAAERVRVHSLFFMRWLVALKVFLAKYSIVGKVVFSDGVNALIMGFDGGVFNINVNGRSVEEIENESRIKAFRKLLKIEIKNMFMWQLG